MMEGPRTAATQSARVLSEVINEKPELVVSLVAKFAKGVSSSNKRVVQTSAEALPAIARIAPARVARQLEVLKTSFETANDVGKDGLVKTFAALCTASVAYQKRLEPVLTLALKGADGKTLLAWTRDRPPCAQGRAACARTRRGGGSAGLDSPLLRSADRRLPRDQAADSLSLIVRTRDHSRSEGS